MGTSSEYLIELKQSLIEKSHWENLWQFIRNNPDIAKRYLYGYEVKLNKIPLHFEEIHKLSSSLPLEDHLYFLCSNRKRNEFPIHIDGIPNTNNAASLNWALKNATQQSPTKWFYASEPTYKIIDGSYFLDTKGPITLLASIPMLSSSSNAYLFRSSTWHQAQFNESGNETRVIIKWMLKFSLWEEANAELRNKNLL